MCVGPCKFYRNMSRLKHWSRSGLIACYSRHLQTCFTKCPSVPGGSGLECGGYELGDWSAGCLGCSGLKGCYGDPKGLRINGEGPSAADDLCEDPPVSEHKRRKTFSKRNGFAIGFQLAEFKRAVLAIWSFLTPWIWVLSRGRNTNQT